LFDFVAIGNPVYDIIKTPFIETLGRILSGCSVNAALTVKMLGMQHVAVAGCIGEDYKDRFIQELERKGIHPIVVKISKETTGFRLRYLDFSGNRELAVLGVSDCISANDLPHEALNSRIILVGPVIGEVCIDVLEELEKRGAKIFLDPQGFLRRVEKGFVEHYSNPNALEACSKSYVVKPNELEAKLLSGENEPLKAAITIYKRTGAITALTLAEKGSIVVDGDRAIIVPAYPTYSIDPTGAGDVYLASLAFYLNLGMDMSDAASYASAVASIKVENVVAHFNIRMSEVERRASWIKSKIKVKRLS